MSPLPEPVSVFHEEVYQLSAVFRSGSSKILVKKSSNYLFSEDKAAIIAYTLLYFAASIMSRLGRLLSIASEAGAFK